MLQKIFFLVSPNSATLKILLPALTSGATSQRVSFTLYRHVPAPALSTNPTPRSLNLTNFFQSTLEFNVTERAVSNNLWATILKKSWLTN